MTSRCCGCNFSFSTHPAQDTYMSTKYMSVISNCSVVCRWAFYIQNMISVKTTCNKLTGRVLETPALSSAIWLSTRQICFAMSRAPSYCCNDFTGWQLHGMFVMSGAMPWNWFCTDIPDNWESNIQPTRYRAIIRYLEYVYLPYILESNPHPFYSFRGLKNEMRITIACGLDSRSRAGFWKNDGAAVRAVRTIQYNNLLFYLLLVII